MTKKKSSFRLKSDWVTRLALIKKFSDSSIKQRDVKRIIIELQADSQNKGLFSVMAKRKNGNCYSYHPDFVKKVEVIIESEEKKIEEKKRIARELKERKKIRSARKVDIKPSMVEGEVIHANPKKFFGGKMPGLDFYDGVMEEVEMENLLAKGVSDDEFGPVDIFTEEEVESESNELN
ncbi:MAG TPA: hypothetical protein PK686_02885 [bacterium]|nr:hypothetical protein [bacterium]HPV65600.1 hypothetical protein [bacterium]